MGGYGSGRPGWRMKVEHYRSLDVNKLHREGTLNPGKIGRWGWWRDNELVARIDYRMEDRGLRLMYKFRQNGGDWQDVDYVVPVIRKRCTFGGDRPYFVCPGVCNGFRCGRTVSKLYGASTYFLCRHCYRLAYNCQSETTIDRVSRRANKKRVRLGGQAGLANPYPRRPKGMWQRTYEREMKAIWKAEELVEQYMAGWLLNRF